MKNLAFDTENRNTKYEKFNYGGVMITLLALFLTFNALIFFIVAKANYYEFTSFGEESEPAVFHAVIKKYQDHRGARTKATTLLSSYKKVKEYRELLASYGSYTNVDYKEALATLDEILRKYEIVAKGFLKSEWYSRDSYKAISRMEGLESEVARVESLTHTSIEKLEDLLKERATTIHDNTEAIRIHKENLIKCDKVRQYNHKAVPLKDLSTNLINMLNELSDKTGMEENREEILTQLKEVSRVLDQSIEELPTFDSNKYVSNKLSVSKNFLEELKKANYEDVLKMK